jgi:hypothetical protein
VAEKPGWSGIRTHGRLASSAVFKTAALNRSAIHPRLYLMVAVSKRILKGAPVTPADDTLWVIQVGLTPLLPGMPDDVHGRSTKISIAAVGVDRDIGTSAGCRVVGCARGGPRRALPPPWSEEAGKGSPSWHRASWPITPLPLRRALPQCWGCVPVPLAA